MFFQRFRANHGLPRPSYLEPRLRCDDCGVRWSRDDIFLVDRPHWATHGFKARAVLDSIRGCLLEGRFTIKGYTVEVSEALSENCCKSLNNSLHGRHARLHSFGYTACLVRAIAQASASPL